MAKLTLAQLKSFTKTYVAAAQQAGNWKATTDNLLKLQDKIGKQITIDGSFQDKLPELSGDDLPYGKTIEEWFYDLVLPKDYDNTGAETLAPNYLSTEEPSYSYTLGRKMIKVTEPYDNLERAALGAEQAGNMISKITERLANSYSLYTYAQKKQLLGNLIDKAIAKGGELAKVIAKPADTATSEAFIKQVKEDVEEASFANEGHSLGDSLIGASPELVLYVKKGVMPTVEVDALAGAFNKSDLAVPAKIKVVDDFGTCNTDTYAILIDPRGVKLHRGYSAVRTQENADADFMNFVQHSESTGFISKHTFVRVYKSK